MKHFLFGLLLLSTLSAAAAAQNQYYVAPSGSNSNSGTTLGSPWSTLSFAEANANVTGGAVINVAAGTYTEAIACGGRTASLCINRSGPSTTTRFVTTCTIQGTCLLRNSSVNGGISIVANNVDVQGFDYGSDADAIVGIVNVCSGNPASGACSTGNSVHIIANLIHDIAQTANDGAGGGPGCPSFGAIYSGSTQHGTSFQNDVQITANKIVNYGDQATAPRNGGSCNVAHGIYSNTPNLFATSNVIVQVPTFGIQVYNQACNTAISNNTIDQAGKGAIVIANGTTCAQGATGRVSINNNIMESAPSGGVSLGTGGGSPCTSTSRVKITNNLTSPGLAITNGALNGCTDISGTITEAPGTTFSGYSATSRTNSYALAGSSLARSAGTSAPGCASGTTLSSCVPVTAFDGSNRPSPPSIGALDISGGSGTPISNVSPASLALGSQPSGVDCTTVTPFTSTYSNTGSGSLTIAGETITGANASDIPFGGVGTCAVGQTLTGGQSCTVSAKLCPAPSSVGNLSAQLNITSNAAAKVVALSGVATAPLTPVLTPPSPLAFGNQNINTTSSPLNYHMVNSGTGPLSVTGLAVAGNFATAGNGTCGALPFTVAVGAFCDRPITFTPLSLGSLAGTVTLTHNAAGSPTVTNLSGTGTQPGATLTPSVTFSTTALNTPSSSQPATLTNTGTGPLTVLATSITAPFSETDSCGARPFTLTPGASCIFNVVCTPNVSGVINGQLQTTDNAPSPTQISALSCTGGTPTSNGLTIKGGVLITGGVRILQPHP